MFFLLDTSICVSILRKEQQVLEKIRTVDQNKLFISDVTVAELKVGAYKSRRTEENLKLVDWFVGNLNVVNFQSGIDEFAKERSRLYELGTPIEDFDLLIATASTSQNLVLVTENEKHMSRVNGIVMENWRRQKN